jgi:hypothetical protein
MNNRYGTQVVAEDGNPAKDTEISVSKKIKKTSKKKKRLAMEMAVPEAMEEPSVEPDPIIEAEEIPHEPTPTECDTPTQAYEEPEAVEEAPEPPASVEDSVEEPPCDNEQQSHMSQRTQPSEGEATVHHEEEVPAISVYLPFSAQHRLMVFLQQKLEEMCFSFSQKHLPNLLRNRDWNCPEAAELHNWMRTLSVELSYTDHTWVVEKSRLLDSVGQIRKFAVTRTRINSIHMEKLMVDALELATLLEEERTVKIIERLCKDMVSTSHSFGAETEQVRKKFDSKLKQIEATRTKLDELENATKAALEKTLLSRQNKARSKVMQSIQRAEAIDQMMDSVDQSVTMSSLDLVNDLENSLMVDDDGRENAASSRSSWFT